MVISARSKDDVSPSIIMSRVETASGAKYSTHKEPTRKHEPIGPVGTNYTPVGKVDINALRREAAVKPPTQPQLTTTRAPGVGKQWSRPAATGFQNKYTPPPPVKSSPAPDNDWEPAPAPTKPTPAPPLPTAKRPTPSAPLVSVNNFIRPNTEYSHRLLRKFPSQPLLPPSPRRKTVLDLWEQTGSRFNFPSLGNSSIRSRNSHRKHSRTNNKPNHRLRRAV